MSHNPSRLTAGQVNRQRAQPPSSISTRKYTSNPAVIPHGEYKTTVHGVAVDLALAEKYTVRYELIHPRNSLGMVVNPVANRLFIVLRGSVFATIQEEGKPPEQIKIQAGTHLNVPKNVAHGLATSGTEAVELYVVEDVGYDDNIEIIEQPTYNRDEKFQEVAANTPIPARKIDHASQIEAALQHAGVTGRPVAQPAPTRPLPAANSANVIGLNPMPSIPRDE